MFELTALSLIQKLALLGASFLTFSTVTWERWLKIQKLRIDLAGAHETTASGTPNTGELERRLRSTRVMAGVAGTLALTSLGVWVGVVAQDVLPPDVSIGVGPLGVYAACDGTDDNEHLVAELEWLVEVDTVSQRSDGISDIPIGTEIPLDLDVALAWADSSATVTVLAQEYDNSKSRKQDSTMVSVQYDFADLDRGLDRVDTITLWPGEQRNDCDVVLPVRVQTSPVPW